MPPKRVIYRNPVPGTVMKRPLPCIDLDPTTLDPDKLLGSTCRNKYRAIQTKGVKFTCPNKGGNGCEGGAFLYPRKLSDKYFHFHQGIDLGWLEPGVKSLPEKEGAAGMPIVSVTSGLVTYRQEWDDKSSGYGTSVAIYDRAGQRLFWYAHCEKGSVTVKPGDEVVEGQIIARVGNTGKAGAPHLHFEVIDSPRDPKTGDPKYTRVIGGESWERELGSKKESPRLDPLEVLEQLGPWGPRQVFEPLGEQLDSEVTERRHHQVEVESYGGYFPLGANNFWHGGMHLPAAEGSLIHAPCDGTIVAVRLAPTEASGSWIFGHTSFILIRHEVPQSVFERMQQGSDAPTPGPEPTKTYSGKIGVGYKVTDPAAVNKAKARLHELGHYTPDDPARLSDGKVEAALGDAIKAFQRTIPNPYKKYPEKWPDGVIDIPGHTWSHLFPPEEASDAPAEPQKPATDPNRTIYVLLMHLQPLTLKEALAADIKWIEKVKLATDAPTEAPVEEEAPKEDLRDREEAESHRIKHDVALGSTDTADIEWVERRLITLGFLKTHSEPTSVADRDLDAAIKAFQAEHPWPTKPANCDGIVSRGGKTDKFLRKTAFELAAQDQAAPASAKKADAIDPAFAAAVAKLDRFGLAEVVSGLDIRVTGGEPLWKSGRAASFNEAGEDGFRQEIHWEVFSEELLLSGWDVIDDKDDDLHADLPATLMERVDLVPDKIVTAPEIFMFYQSEDCRPLRRTACRFRSEWNLDLDQTLARLDELQFNTMGLAEALEPYQWWDRARDVLPDVNHVWHYNPIEFFRVYQEILDSMKPPPAPEPGSEPPAKPLDPATYGKLIVHVAGANGMPPKQTVTVVVSNEEGVGDWQETDKGGVARFDKLPVGDYEVYLQEVEGVGQPTHVGGYWDREVLLETQLAGQPETRGQLTVWVRKASGGAAVGAAVTIQGPNLDREFGELRVGKKSTAVFDDLQAGEYHLHIVYPKEPAEAEDRVEINEFIKYDGKKQAKVRVTVPRPWSDVVVYYDDGGVRTAGALFNKKGKLQHSFTTDASGKTAFRIDRGEYKLVLGSRKLDLDARQPTTEVTI
ncbi:peptidoglycan DD-metalloendopeptidase family protein [Nannocystis pusilla]|uniref:Peptidoglycan DD-metalloendopeptidase family protein n=1 Tax=Nannocystis pusilla TaxID=889268 RepID=A0ABS7TM11_9BACT|nr:peptidoglycan DD-metalloendopeptidase family protein [Nannocystis pusilla]MBZ5709254.1 peptidoglycan DD-metalloendopeptidase family protein [Nannocystis pusilla]